MTPAELDRFRSYAIAAAALLLTVPLGIVAASDAHSFVLAGVGALAVATATAWGFRRDPVMVLVALWAFQIIRTPLAAATQSVPFAGTLLNQLTDVCVVVILLSLAWEALGRNPPRRNLRYFWPAIGLAVCGLAGSVLQNAPLQPTVMGLWLGTKFWLLVGVTVAAAWRPGDVERMVRVLVVFGATAAGLGIIDAATRGAVANVLDSDYKQIAALNNYRAQAAQSLYAHPNEYSLAMCLLVAIWIARVATRDRVRPRDLALLGLFIVAAVVSLRLKAVLSISALFAVAAAFQLYRGKRSGRRQALVLVGGAAVVVALIFSFMGNVIERQVQYYAGSTPTARGQLYVGGAQIAWDHFPFGVGFGRYGSAPSRTTYSDVYDTYQLSLVWGLSRDFPRFITDTSWPAVMGETGVAGVAVFAAGLLALLAAGIGTLRTARGPDAFAPLALIGLLVVVLVDSVGNTTLFTWNTITIVALFAGATLSQQRAVVAAHEAQRPDPWQLTPSRPRPALPRADPPAARPSLPS